MTRCAVARVHEKRERKTPEDFPTSTTQIRQHPPNPNTKNDKKKEEGGGKREKRKGSVTREVNRRAQGKRGGGGGGKNSFKYSSPAEEKGGERG